MFYQRFIPYIMMLFKLFQKKSQTQGTSVASTTQATLSTDTKLEAGSQTTQTPIPTEPSVEIKNNIESLEVVMKTDFTQFIQSIHQMPLDSDEYIKEECAKYQIYLHHTAGNASARNTVSNWNNDKRGRIATCITISNTGATNSQDGEVVQAFSSKYWAYHLGLKNEHFQRFDTPYRPLDKHSIGIELCAWGPLELRGGKFYNYVNREVLADQVCELESPFKGHIYYHKYTDAQIEAVRNLLIYWNNAYDIPLDYNPDIWDLTERAFKMEPGVYTHNSVRKDKSDVFPQPELIEMLKSLS